MDDYMDLLGAVEHCVQQLEPKYQAQAEELLKQIRWAATYNFKFREESFPYLESILDELYEKLNG